MKPGGGHVHDWVEVGCSSTSRYDRPKRRYQRTASTITSGGKRKPAKADRGIEAGRGRRGLMPTVSRLEGGHRERNSAVIDYTRAGASPEVATEGTPKLPMAATADERPSD